MSVLAQGDELVLGAARAMLGAAASAALVLACAARPWRGRAEPLRPSGAPLALGVATAVAFGMTRGWPAFPPTQALHRFFHAALVAAVYGALEPRRGPAVRIGRVLLSVLLPVVLLEFQRERHWGRTEGILFTACLAACLFVAWDRLAAQEQRGDAGAATTMGLALATALAAGSYGLAGGALFAQLAGAFALALGLCALLGLWRRSPGLGASGVAAYVPIHYGLLWIARWVNELSTTGFVLLTLVPLAALAAGLVPALRPRTRTACALLGPTLLAAAALLVESRSSIAAEPYY